MRRWGPSWCDIPSSGGTHVASLLSLGSKPLLCCFPLCPITPLPSRNEHLGIQYIFKETDRHDYSGKHRTHGGMGQIMNFRKCWALYVNHTNKLQMREAQTRFPPCTICFVCALRSECAEYCFDVSSPLLDCFQLLLHLKKKKNWNKRREGSYKIFPISSKSHRKPCDGKGKVRPRMANVGRAQHRLPLPGQAGSPSQLGIRPPRVPRACPLPSSPSSPP